MSNIDLLGYIAGILVVLSLLPQAVRSWKTKSTRDLSLPRYIVYIIGLILWIVYAVIIHNGPVALTNGIGLIIATFILYLKLRHG